MYVYKNMSLECWCVSRYGPLGWDSSCYRERGNCSGASCNTSQKWFRDTCGGWPQWANTRPVSKPERGSSRASSGSSDKFKSFWSETWDPEGRKSDGVLVTSDRSSNIWYTRHVCILHWYIVWICQRNDTTTYRNLCPKSRPSSSVEQVQMSWQDKLRRAAKARIMRWVAPKKKRMDREAPDVVKEQWAKGNKSILADLFSKVNFDQDWLLYRLNTEHVILRRNVWYMCFIIGCVANPQSQDNFVNELKILVSKKQLVEMTIEEGWYSEAELKTVFKWSQRFT